MFQLYGLDQAKRIRPASVFSETEVEPGCFVSREIIKPTDIYTASVPLVGVVAGSYFIQTTALPANYLYCILNISLYLVTGAAGLVTLGINHSASNVNLAGISPFAAGILYV